MLAAVPRPGELCELRFQAGAIGLTFAKRGAAWVVTECRGQGVAQCVLEGDEVVSVDGQAVAGLAASAAAPGAIPGVIGPATQGPLVVTLRASAGTAEIGRAAYNGACAPPLPTLLHPATARHWRRTEHRPRPRPRARPARPPPPPPGGGGRRGGGGGGRARAGGGAGAGRRGRDPPPPPSPKPARRCARRPRFAGAACGSGLCESFGAAGRCTARQSCK